VAVTLCDPVNRIVSTCGVYAKPFTSDGELAQ